MRPYRADLQMVFQDPYSSLNPRMTVGADRRGAAAGFTRRTTPAERRDRVRWLLEKVGLSAEHATATRTSSPAGSASASASRARWRPIPKIVIADEPVSALDVSIQAQVINLMQDLQEEFGLSYIFIAHDLSVVRHISDRIAVMYLGHIVESGPADDVYDRPMHPYSQLLLSAVPRPDPDARRSQRPDRRRPALAAQQAVRMRVPHALPDRAAVVRRRRAAAGVEERPLGSLSLRGIGNDRTELPPACPDGLVVPSCLPGILRDTNTERPGTNKRAG